MKDCSKTPNVLVERLQQNPNSSGGMTAATTQNTQLGFRHDRNVSKLCSGCLKRDALRTSWLSVLSPVEIAGRMTVERSLALSTCGRAATSETVLSS